MDARAKKQLKAEIEKAIKKAALAGMSGYERVDDFVIGWLYHTAGLKMTDVMELTAKAIEAAKGKQPLI